MKMESIIRILDDYSDRNSIQLSMHNFKIEKHKVNLHRYKLNGGKENLGDYLSEVVVDYMLQKATLSRDVSVKSTKHLYAIGSIIGAGWQNATIWGTGFLSEQPTWLKHTSKYVRKLDIRAVRGPETGKILKSMGYEVPSVYGDPAILMKDIYNPGVCGGEKAV